VILNSKKQIIQYSLMLNEKDTINLYNMIYNLSLNMLRDMEDAEDATHDIFIKIMEHIDEFKNESKIETWAYRIAYNFLIDYSKSRFKNTISFELFEKNVNDFIPYSNELGLSKEEEKIYIEEIKTGCTMAMLQCLDAKSRFVYILGNIFGLDSSSGSEICRISEANYRKILSRSRNKITNFMNKNCGLVNKKAFCKCSKRLKIAIDNGRINQNRVISGGSNNKIADYLQEMNEIDEISKIFRDNPYIDRMKSFPNQMQSQFNLLNEE
jgi:RNA polymerase sigma factor (sigma-70 family)